MTLLLQYYTTLYSRRENESKIFYIIFTTIISIKERSLSSPMRLVFFDFNTLRKLMNFQCANFTKKRMHYP